MTIAVIALVISAISAAVAVGGFRLLARDGSRRDVELRLLRDEAGRRDEELHLLRQRLDDERAERLEQQRARLVSTKGTTRSDKHRVEYDVIVRNAGPYPALGVSARTENGRHEPSRHQGVAPMLMPGEAATVTFVGYRPAGVGAGGDLAMALLLGHQVVLEWWDGLGHHEEPTALGLAFL